jgi:hypothetical protein
MRAGTVRIHRKLVPFLRSGVKREYASALRILTFQVETAYDSEEYDNALGRFDNARHLMHTVGITEDEPSPSEYLELDLDRYGADLVLKCLESEYDIEVSTRQDRSSEGFPVPLGELPDFTRLVNEIRERSGRPPRRQRTRWRPLTQGLSGRKRV